VEVWQTSSLRPVRSGEEKRKKERKKKQDKNTMSASATQGGHNYTATVGGGEGMGRKHRIGQRKGEVWTVPTWLARPANATDH